MVEGLQRECESYKHSIHGLMQQVGIAQLHSLIWITLDESMEWQKNCSMTSLLTPRSLLPSLSSYYTSLLLA